jgi:ribosomal protein S20
MPITSSAKKALRVSKKKRVFNMRRKNEIDRRIKAFRVMITEKKHAEAAKSVPALYKALDKAVKTKYIKANTASRTKSRIMAALNKVSAK